MRCEPRAVLSGVFGCIDRGGAEDAGGDAGRCLWASLRRRESGNLDGVCRRGRRAGVRQDDNVHVFRQRGDCPPGRVVMHARHRRLSCRRRQARWHAYGRGTQHLWARGGATKRVWRLHRAPFGSQPTRGVRVESVHWREGDGSLECGALSLTSSRSEFPSSRLSSRPSGTRTEDVFAFGGSGWTGSSVVAGFCYRGATK